MLPSDFSPQWISIPPLEADEFHPLAAATWIGPNNAIVPSADALAAYHVRFELPINRAVASAWLHFWIEGRPHNDTTFDAPELASQSTPWKAGLVNGSGKVRFGTFDRLLELNAPNIAEIGPLLQEGSNTLALLSWATLPQHAIIARIVGEFDDGVPFSLSSDEGWRCQILSVDEARDPAWHTRLDHAPKAAVRSKFGEEPWEDKRSRINQPQPPIILRATFNLPALPINSAWLEASAIGIYETELNGRKVGEDWLAPGWTDTRKTLHCQRHEVTNHLQPGANTWTATVAAGWAGSWMQGCTSLREPAKAFHATLMVRLIDGSTLRFPTRADEWQGATGSLREATIYGGESLDLTREPRWRPACALPAPLGRLLPEPCPQARMVREMPPMAIRQTGANAWLVDFGRNFTGVVRLTLDESRGQMIELRYAESLRKDGSLMRTNLKAAACLDRVVCPGGPFIFQPRFTFRGFRYLEIQGTSQAPVADAIRGLAISSVQRETLKVNFAHEPLNQLLEMIRWTQRSNWLSVPMDCPQRSERLGWMGDNEIYAPTGLLLFDGCHFQAKHVDDIYEAAHPNGALADFVPCGGGAGPVASYGWGDAGVVIPHAIWKVHGDLGPARKHWEGIRAYLAHRDANADEEGLNVTGSYGDWLTIEPKTPHAIMGPIFHAYTHRLAAELAESLGENKVAAHHRRRFDEIGEIWRCRHLQPDGTIESDTQGVYLCAWDTGLIPSEARPRVARALRATFTRWNDHARTGILSTARLLDVLIDAGFDDLAWHILTDDTFPSFGYFLKNGATTMPEWWDPWPDGNETTEYWANATLDRANGELPSSLNHPVFGAVGRGIIRHVWGLRQAEDDAGFRKVVIAPRFTDRLEFCRGSFHSAHGEYQLDWQREAQGVRFTIVIPEGCSGTLCPTRPDQDPIALTVGCSEHFITPISR